MSWRPGATLVVIGALVLVVLVVGSAPFSWLALAAVLVVLWALVHLARQSHRQRRTSEALRETIGDLEARVTARTAELRDSTAWLRSIIDSAVDGIVVIDALGRIEAFNPGAQRLFGYREPEVMGRNVSMLMPQPYRDEHDGYINRYLKTGTARIIGIGRQVTGLRRDGTTFPLRLSVGEIPAGRQRKFVGILHDLSEREALEAQLREQTAMARLGEMAAVIAHEVKNPLAGVRGAITVIGGRLPSDSKDRPVVQEILERLDALDDLIKDLLLFARPPQPRPARVDVAPLIASTAALLRQDPSLRDVHVEIQGSPPPILADAEMLRIVFHNLLVNGAHAMQGHGVIRVSTTAEDGACRIAFADSGPGISPEIVDKVFTPFFTTKARGSGLGLPTAKRLVEAHGGRIRVECPPAGGTTVVIEIPTPSV
jgi:two-component system sensor kinase FixL